MLRYALIVAGGTGKRMQAEVPKQFLLLNGLPVLMYTLRAFYAYSSSIKIILVLPTDQFSYWHTLCQKYTFDIPHELVAGGHTRFHSVKNGLSVIADEGIVAIHDGVRPFISPSFLDTLFTIAQEKGSALPVLSVVDSMRELVGQGSRVVDRSMFKLVQTPQCFSLKAISLAYQLPYIDTFTDDASVYEYHGGQVYLVDGVPENIKITTPSDLLYAQWLIDKQ